MDQRIQMRHAALLRAAQRGREPSARESWRKSPRDDAMAGPEPPRRQKQELSGRQEFDSRNTRPRDAEAANRKVLGFRMAKFSVRPSAARVRFGLHGL